MMSHARSGRKAYLNEALAHAVCSRLPIKLDLKETSTEEWNLSHVHRITRQAECNVQIKCRETCRKYNLM